MNVETAPPTQTTANQPSLTPATDQMAPFANSRYLSSTRASIDSDSEYQYTGAASNAGSGTSTSERAPGVMLDTPSRPISRSSSTLSGVSTTATKDGVDGKRLHRAHDPTSYLSWLQRSPTSGAQFSRMDVEYSDDGQSSVADGDSTTPDASGSANAEFHVANEPSAPPVTLNEKIQLLRTGSVPGAGGPSHSTNSKPAPPPAPLEP